MQLEEFKKKYNYSKSTPVIQQYLDIKFTNIDCLLLFRMGDFYELFYEDAITASRTLGIALTKRGKSGDDEIAMCGVPHHALENYLNKLLEEGFKVAICDQVETPEEAKKRGGYKAVVKRTVTRIITPGTIIEESLLQSREPNYLASISIDKKEQNAAICYTDLSTSEIAVITVPVNEVINELARIRPKEVLLSDKHRISDLASLISTQLNLHISFQVDSFFSYRKCENIILEFYKIKSTDAIGNLNHEAVGAVGSIIEYLSLTQKDNLPNLPMPKILNYHKFMNIDAATRRNLELNVSLSGSIKGSLFDCLDKTKTKAGSRLLYRFLASPLIDIKAINNRLDITDFFYKNLALTEQIRLELKKTGDLERCIARLNMRRSTPKDLLSIKYTLEIAEQIRARFISSCSNDLPAYIEELVSPLIGNHEIHDLIDNTIKEDAPNILTDGKIIKSSYHPKVSELNELIDNSRKHVELLRDKYRKQSGIETLKISNNNVIGLFIEVSSKHSGKNLGDEFIHRQTTANSIRYTTENLQELESKIVNAKLMVVSLEQEIYHDICNQIIHKQQALLQLAEALARLDVFCSFAYKADECEYTKPILLDDMSFEINGGCHPIVEQALRASNESFIRNECKLSCDERIWLITGPNMSGKSTFLRQNAVIAIMAHIGSYVPADSAKIGVVDKIFSRIGAGDDLTKGQSTFMVEMLETSAILAQSTHRSLIILDEVGRGTSTYDGVAIAWSVLEHIHDKIRARCLFATHYHELTSMSEILPALDNYTVAIHESDNKILFLHQIKKGSADKSYGVHVAQLAGLPKPVIKKANILLKKFEKDAGTINKQVMEGESYNMNLFEFAPNSEENAKYKKLYEEFEAINPDKLTPKEALDIIYKLKF